VAKGINRLTNAFIAHCPPGKYRDGAGLILRHRPSPNEAAEGQKNWIFQYKFGGRTREMGLGSYFHSRGPRGFSCVTLAAARQARDAALALLKRGLDPLEERNKATLAAAVATAKTKTFDECARDYIESHAPAWRGPKSREQWEASLRDYASPVFGRLPVDQIDVQLVLQVVEPIWVSKNVTADRVRVRIKLILHAAMARGFRPFGLNPASLEALAHVLPPKRRLKKVSHLPALPYAEIPAFMAKLLAETSVAAAALAFAILTAARSGEVTGAAWGEISRDGKDLWNLHGNRMKSGRPHTVPLSAPALAILARMELLRQGDGSYIFPSFNPRAREGLNDRSLLRALRRLGVSTTVHGFRSGFSDWAYENDFSRDIIEAALSHTIGSAVEKAYRRGEALGKRRLLLESWGEFCTGTEREKVVRLRREK